MDQALTLNSVYQLGLLLGLIAGLWWRVETRISSAATDALARADEAFKKAELAHSQLNDFKLEVAQNYAKNGFLKDVEDRLGERFDAIVGELHGMRQDFNKAMVEMASHNSSKRTPRS